MNLPSYLRKGLLNNSFSEFKVKYVALIKVSEMSRLNPRYYEKVKNPLSLFKIQSRLRVSI